MDGTHHHAADGDAQLFRCWCWWRCGGAAELNFVPQARLGGSGASTGTTSLVLPRLTNKKGLLPCRQAVNCTSESEASRAVGARKPSAQRKQQFQLETTFRGTVPFRRDMRPLTGIVQALQMFVPAVPLQRWDAERSQGSHSIAPMERRGNMCCPRRFAARWRGSPPLAPRRCGPFELHTHDTCVMRRTPVHTANRCVEDDRNVGQCKGTLDRDREHCSSRGVVIIIPVHAPTRGHGHLLIHHDAGPHQLLKSMGACCRLASCTVHLRVALQSCVNTWIHTLRLHQLERDARGPGARNSIGAPGISCIPGSKDPRSMSPLLTFRYTNCSE